MGGWDPLTVCEVAPSYSFESGMGCGYLLQFPPSSVWHRPLLQFPPPHLMTPATRNLKRKTTARPPPILWHQPRPPNMTPPPYSFLAPHIITSPPLFILKSPFFGESPPFFPTFWVLFYIEYLFLIFLFYFFLVILGGYPPFFLLRFYHTIIHF